jgi:hypothetical protein
MQLTYRKLNGDPPSYRVSFEGIEIGSITLRTNHITNADYWHWCVDVMPLTDGGHRPPDGDAGSFEAASGDLKLAFEKWLASFPADLWQENLEHKRAGQGRWRVTS